MMSDTSSGDIESTSTNATTSSSPSLYGTFNCTIVDQFKKTILRLENDFIGSDNNISGIRDTNINNYNNYSHIAASNSSGNNPILSRLSPPVIVSPKLQHHTHPNNNHPHQHNHHNFSISEPLPPSHLPTSTSSSSSSSSTTPGNSSITNTTTSNQNPQPIKLFIGNSRKSIFYILVTLATGTITNCHDCTIALGPCCDSIEITDCSSLTIISTTKSIKIKSSSNITVYICTNQKPIIYSDCHDIKFAPYNTHYPTLENQIAQAKLNVNLSNNLWSSPEIVKTLEPLPASASSSLELGISPTDTLSNIKSLNINELNHNGQQHQNYNNNNHHQTTTIFTLVEPEDFYPFTIPFNLKGKTKSNPCELPPKYSNSLNVKSNTIQSLHKHIQQSTNDQKIRVHLLHLIESKFHQWLLESDNIRQINDLINMEHKASNSGFFNQQQQQLQQPPPSNSTHQHQGGVVNNPKQ